MANKTYRNTGTHVTLHVADRGESVTLGEGESYTTDDPVEQDALKNAVGVQGATAEKKEKE